MNRFTEAAIVRRLMRAAMDGRAEAAAGWNWAEENGYPGVQLKCERAFKAYDRRVKAFERELERLGHAEPAEAAAF